MYNINKLVSKRKPSVFYNTFILLINNKMVNKKMNEKSIIIPVILILILSFTGSIYFNQIALADPPKLYYQPQSQDFGDKLEGMIDYSTFIIWNVRLCGSGDLIYELSETCNWIDIDPTSGYTECEPDVITISLNTSGLSLGYHSCEILIDSNVGNGIFPVTVNIVDNINNPPNKPIITGETNGNAGNEYDYIISSVDPDGDDVYFEIEWFIGCPGIFWEGPYKSGEQVIKSNTWNEEGNYTITVRVKDSNGLEGESSTLINTMPNQKFIQSLFQQFIRNHQILNLLLQLFT